MDADEQTIPATAPAQTDCKTPRQKAGFLDSRSDADRISVLPVFAAGSATVSQLEEAEPAPEPEPQPLVQTVRFSATGDNLIHSPIYKQAKRRAAGTEGYSFDYVCEHIAPFHGQLYVNSVNQ